MPGSGQRIAPRSARATENCFYPRMPLDAETRIYSACCLPTAAEDAMGHFHFTTIVLPD